MKKLMIALLIGVPCFAMNTVNVACVDQRLCEAALAGDHPSVIIEFVKGQKVPVSFNSRGDLLALDYERPLLATVEHTFYAQFQKEGIELSTDGICWKPFTEFAKGSINVSLEKGGLAFSLEANIRG